MKTEVNPQDTNRAEAFELWMSSPMPMVTLTKTFDVEIVSVRDATQEELDALVNGCGCGCGCDGDCSDGDCGCDGGCC